ncbi:MAG: hypothetical protein ACPGTP_03370 [Bacteroidia bacterium]
MKLNKDNYELMMFDLLEGNLSESQELVLMKQIEEDEFFFKEWKLFKSTVLVADTKVVYTQKDSLLKEETAVFPIRRIWMTIAASVCLLAVAYVFWPTTTVDQPIALNREIESPVVVDSSTSSPTLPAIEDIEVVPENESEEFIVKTHSPSNQEEAPQIIELPESENEVVEIENTEMEQKIDHIAIDEARKKVDQKMLEEYESKQKEEQQIAKIDPEPAKEDISPKIEIIEEPKEIIADVSTEDDKNEKRKIAEFVTNNPAKRIKEKATEIIALVSNPKVKIRPSFNNSRPSLNIELETSGYSAVASLQPFKNRNNH